MNKDTNNFSDTILINNKKYIYFNLIKAAKKTWVRSTKITLHIQNFIRKYFKARN